MTERLIGYGYTNSSGVATLDYDANGTQLDPTGYTGVGAGVVDIKAKLHDDSSLVSEPYPLLDCIFLDKNGATWTTGSGSTTFSDDVRTFTTSTDTNFYSNNDTPFTGDFACEFDLIDYYGGNMLRFYGDTGKQISFSELGGVSQGCHIMIKSLNKQVTIFVDGVQKSYNFSYTSNGLELGFRVLANMLTKISNYKVYPI